MSNETRHPTKKLVLPDTGNVVHIDVKLFSGIQRLNELGFTTKFCCQGGGLGYNIAYLVLAAGKDFPPELLHAWQGAGFDASPTCVYAMPTAEQMQASASCFCTDRFYTDCSPSSDRSRRKRSGMQFPPELLTAWHGTRYVAPASAAYAWRLHGQEQEFADSFCRSLDDWVQGKLDLSGASYRVVSALCTRSLQANPAESANPTNQR